MHSPEEFDRRYKAALSKANKEQRKVLIQSRAVEDQIIAAERDGNKALMTALIIKQMKLMKRLVALSIDMPPEAEGENV